MMGSSLHVHAYNTHTFTHTQTHTHTHTHTLSTPTPGRWNEAASSSIPALVLLAYSGVLCWSIGGVSFYHLYLIATNQTTYESLRCAGGCLSGFLHARRGVCGGPAMPCCSFTCQPIVDV